MNSQKPGILKKGARFFLLFITHLGKNADFGWKHGAKWCIIENNRNAMRRMNARKSKGVKRGGNTQ
jgi:hypothetical protein